MMRDNIGKLGARGALQRVDLGMDGLDATRRGRRGSGRRRKAAPARAQPHVMHVAQQFRARGVALEASPRPRRSARGRRPPRSSRVSIGSIWVSTSTPPSKSAWIACSSRLATSCATPSVMRAVDFEIERHRDRARRPAGSSRGARTAAAAPAISSTRSSTVSSSSASGLAAIVSVEARPSRREQASPRAA